MEDLKYKTLSHFGIPGMRWGIRRKVGPDGRVIQRGSQSKKSEDYIRSREQKKRGHENLSTKELRELTQRMQLEKSLRELNMSDYSKGMDTARTILSVGTTMTALYALGATPLGQEIRKRLTRS